MKRLLMILMLAMALHLQAAVPVSIDSLRQVVALAEGDDKSGAYTSLCQALMARGETDATLLALTEWTAYEQHRGNIVQEGNARYMKVVMLSNYGMDDALLDEVPAQMEWFAANGQWEHYYNVWEAKTTTYMYTDRMQAALHEGNLMLADAQQRDNDFGRVVSYMLTGVVYESMGLMEPALENLKRAYDMLLTGEFNHEMFYSVCDYYAQTLGEHKDYALELEVTTKWLEAIMKQQRQYHKGDSYLRGTMLSSWLQRAEALTGLKRFDEAAQALAKAEECLTYIDIPLTRARVLFFKTKLQNAQGNCEEALLTLDSLQAMRLDIGGSLDLLRGDILMCLGRTEEAAVLYRQEYETHDSVFSRDMRTQLDELATLHHVDELEAKNRMVTNRLLMAIVVIVLVALVVLMLMHYRASKRLKQKNEELSQKNLELEQANLRAEDSLKMKSEFIKSISHEIRTPLNILSGFTQIVTSPNVNMSKEQLADVHKRINENTDRIVSMVNKLLELSDANSHQPLDREDLVKAGELVGEAIHAARLVSTPEVRLNWDTTGPLVSVSLLTNRKYAVSALTCLVDNARKFTQKGNIAIRLRKKGTQLLFVVEDTGIGVEAEQADRIFEEFVQVDKYTEGAGIGLTVARNIVRRLKGDVWLDISYTAGARFILSLPMG